MGTDVYGLVTDWERVVADCREAGGLDFFWDADMELPYADVVELPGGRARYELSVYYDRLRPHLPARLRDDADTVFGPTIPDMSYDWQQGKVDDLSADTNVRCGADVMVAMRPATARAFAAIDLPWDDLDAIGKRLPDDDSRTLVPRWDAFHWRMGALLRCVHDAAAAGRGVVVIESI
jgi:hypothetical protein